VVSASRKALCVGAGREFPKRYQTGHLTTQRGTVGRVRGLAECARICDGEGLGRGFWARAGTGGVTNGPVSMKVRLGQKWSGGMLSLVRFIFIDILKRLKTLVQAAD